MNKIPNLIAQSVGLVPDQCNNHAVEIEEEHEQMKTQFDK